MHIQQKTQKAMRTNKITTKRKMPLLKTINKNFIQMIL